MYSSQQPWVVLYDALQAYEGDDAYADLLAPWVDEHEDERAWLRSYVEEPRSDDESLCRLYAASRVTSLLLLRFQPGDRDYPGPAVTLDGFLRFHTSLGFGQPYIGGFHPFYHEIVGVRQADDPVAPIRIVEELWPPLMLVRMMFCRGGCIVSAGAEHVRKELAERSRLHWAFRRRDRPCADPSHGWGGNSRWRTRFRRDYQAAMRFEYNVDGGTSLNGVVRTVDGIPVAAMIELVRNRCLVRTAMDDSDLYPYPYSCMEPYEQVPA